MGLRLGDQAGIDPEVRVGIVPAGRRLNCAVVNVTANAPTQAQIGNNDKRLTITITNPYATVTGGPTDGNLMIVNATENLTATKGHYLPPGSSITLSNYKGRVALLAPNAGGSTLLASYLEEAAD